MGSLYERLIRGFGSVMAEAGLNEEETIQVRSLRHPHLPTTHRSPSRSRKTSDFAHVSFSLLLHRFSTASLKASLVEGR